MGCGEICANLCEISLDPNGLTRDSFVWQLLVFVWDLIGNAWDLCVFALDLRTTHVELI